MESSEVSPQAVTPVEPRHAAHPSVTPPPLSARAEAPREQPAAKEEGPARILVAPALPPHEQPAPTLTGARFSPRDPALRDPVPNPRERSPVLCSRAPGPAKAAGASRAPLRTPRMPVPTCPPAEEAWKEWPN